MAILRRIAALHWGYLLVNQNYGKFRPVLGLDRLRALGSHKHMINDNESG